MCDFTSGIKLCTCGEEIRFREQASYKKVRRKLVNLSDKKNEEIPLIFIWQLFRHVGKHEEGMILGQYRFPDNDIGKGLNAEWIALNLNTGNCFDFEYTPQAGDNLVIRQNVDLGPYISFIYENDEWKNDHYDPFVEITELVSEGKVEPAQR